MYTCLNRYINQKNRYWITTICTIQIYNNSHNYNIEQKYRPINTYNYIQLVLLHYYVHTKN
jgi:hypothetical protein